MKASPLVGKIHLKISRIFRLFDIVKITIGTNAVANAQISADCTVLHFAEKNSILAPTATSESSPPATMTLYIFPTVNAGI